MTMCTSTECPMKKECYRANSNTNEHQDCFNYEYGCNENSGFEDFISVKCHPFFTQVLAISDAYLPRLVAHE